MISRQDFAESGVDFGMSAMVVASPGMQFTFDSFLDSSSPALNGKPLLRE